MQEDHPIQVLMAATGEEKSVDMRQLIDMIASGSVAGEDRVKGRLLTDGVWKELAQMRIFYAVRRVPLPEGILEDYTYEDAAVVSEPMASSLGLLLNLIALGTAIVCGGFSMLFTFVSLHSPFDWQFALLACSYGAAVITGGIALFRRKPYGWWIVFLNTCLISTLWFVGIMTPDMDFPDRRYPSIGELALFVILLGAALVLLIGNPWRWRSRRGM